MLLSRSRVFVFLLMSSVLA
jgi:hypothetical protein